MKPQAYVIRVFRDGKYWVATAKAVVNDERVDLPQRGVGDSSVEAHCDLLEKIAAS